MAIKNERVECPYCGRAMVHVEGRKYLCPKRCLTRPITRQEAASWLKKKAAQSDLEPSPGGLLF